MPEDERAETTTAEQPDEPREADQSTGVMAGVGLTFLLHLVFQSLWANVAPEMNPFEFIGISQLPYMVVAIVVAMARRKRAIAKGLGIGLAATFLLNAACFGFVLATFSLH